MWEARVVKKKSIFLAALIFISLSAVSVEAYGGVFKDIKEGLYLMLDACGMLPEEFIKSRAEKDKDAALAYLNDRYAKYGDVFTPVSHIPGGWAYDFDEVVFKSQKYGENFEVRLREDTHEPYVDGYWQLYMRDDAVTYFNSLITGYEAHVPKVHFSRGPERYYGSFAEFADRGDCRVDVNFFFRKRIDEVLCHSILEKIAKRKIWGHFYFVTIKEGFYSTGLTLSEVASHMSKYIACEQHYDIDGPNEIIRTK